MAKSSSINARSPQAGDVIAFAYLWNHESKAGLVNGVKMRHCVIVRVSESGLVAVMPITGTQPTHTNTVQLQGGRLGLARASWIVTQIPHKARGGDMANCPKQNATRSPIVFKQG